ncbi:MAG: glycosyltransferase [Verrucomicrobiota bacterium]|nr:glycosyltransferase [Verrucomicrobiota bacterium]
MKICDVTQFYSPLSGGVKRYVQEKIAFIQAARPKDEHVLIVPGAKSECIVAERSRIYTIRSPLVSRATQYRALLDLRALGQIIEKERPDVIESADPYQVGWKAMAVGRLHEIPVVGFYHSHFTEAYLRRPAERFRAAGGKLLIDGAHAYLRALYNRFDTTLVPSRGLLAELQRCGVRNARQVDLGVNTAVFTLRNDSAAVRLHLGVPAESSLLLYVGRLAQEKNTATLFQAFKLLSATVCPNIHLLVIGDGQEREALQELIGATAAVTWIPYCADAEELARYYWAADLFVHPGVQETFGLVALESQACGTPVVGIRGTNLDDVILHSQSTWATENTPAALAGAIERTLALPSAEIGAAAAGLVAERFAWRGVFQRLFAIYREVSARYRETPPA